LLCGAAGSRGLGRAATYFGQRAPLAGDLALSVYWLATPVRWCGSVQHERQGRALGGWRWRQGRDSKIRLYDLSNLDALYRIASFFALALIALAVACIQQKASSKSF